MPWMTTCAGCGMTLRFGGAQTGRALACPGCRLCVTSQPPRPVEAPPPPRRSPGRRRGRWLAGGIAGLVVAASVVGAACLAWFREPPPREGPINILAMGLPRAGKGPALVAAPGNEVGVPDPAAARPDESTIDGNTAPEAKLTAREAERGREFAFVGKVPANLAAAADPATGRLLVSGLDGRLHWIDGAGLRPIGSCLLPRPAYQLAVDAKRRLLYAASATTLDVGRLGDRERAAGDVHVYDLDAILKGDDPQPKPLRQLGLDAHVTGLLLSASGDALYYATEALHDVQIGRVDTRSWRRDKILWVRVPGPTALALAPDRPVLYALLGGRLLALDPAAWKVLDSVPVSSSVTSFVPGKGNVVFLLERRYQSQVQVVDLPARRMLARWSLETDGRPYLRLSPDGSRLFIGTSAVTAGRVWGIDVTGEKFGNPALARHAASDRTRLLRGGLHLAGPLVLTGSGYVFREEEQ